MHFIHIYIIYLNLYKSEIKNTLGFYEIHVITNKINWVHSISSNALLNWFKNFALFEATNQILYKYAELIHTYPFICSVVMKNLYLKGSLALPPTTKRESRKGKG